MLGVAGVAALAGQARRYIRPYSESIDRTAGLSPLQGPLWGWVSDTVPLLN